MAGRINANYMTINSGDIIGDLDILDLNLENSQGSNDIGDIRIKSHSNDNVHRINLNSSFADGSFVGSKPFTGNCRLSARTPLTGGKVTIMMSR